MNKKRLRILAIGPTDMPSYQIGVRQPLSRLADRKLIFLNESDYRDNISSESIADADVIVFVRTVTPETYRYFKLAKSLNKKTVYVIDDHLLAVNPKTRLGRHTLRYRRNYLRFLKKADVVKVTSLFFYNRLRTRFKLRNVIYFPNSVDFSLFKGLQKQKPRRSAVRIGYQGGLKEKAFAPVIPAIKKIIKEYKGKVTFEFLGSVPAELKRYRNIKIEKYNDNYKNFLKHLYQKNWDIGLAPLEKSLLHQCKTNNKFREYAACQIPGIYTSAPPYRDWVIHEETGLLATYEGEGWYEGMKTLIDNPSLRDKIRKNALTVARQHFTVKKCASNWRELILKI